MEVINRETTILNNIISIIIKYLNPNKIILFGSRAKETHGKNADFDVAIDQKRVDIRLERKIREDIEKVAGLYKIDIVFLNSVDEVFKKIILQTGKVIYASGS